MSLTGTSVASSDSQEYLPNGQLPSQRKLLQSRDDVENAAFQDYGTPVISLSFEKGSSIRTSIAALVNNEIHTGATSTEAAQSCFQTGSRSSILQGQTPTTNKNNTVDGKHISFFSGTACSAQFVWANATYLGKTRGSERSMSMFSVSPRSAGCLTIAEKVVGSFLFLRFCFQVLFMLVHKVLALTSITSPETNALLLSEKLTTPRRRGLVLCGKLLTALCNDIEFGNKEDYLMVFNDYLKDYREAMKEYISYASSPSPPANLQSLSNADTPAYLKAEPEKSPQESQIPDHLQMGIPNPLLPYDSPGYMILESPDVDKPVTPTSSLHLLQQPQHLSQLRCNGS
ncbi:hypothetical protein BSLG_003259 [Batrachochytrium salamandrivorans]|nr:hypothetical protein BSLG_003259 [Batrachochytrium salamandrivorans]